METAVPKSFFNKVAGLRLATLLKRRLWHRCFPVKFCEISQNTFYYRAPLVTASRESKKSYNNVKPKIVEQLNNHKSYTAH